MAGKKLRKAKESSLPLTSTTPDGSPPARIHSSGGAVILGSVDLGQESVFVGRDLVTEERAYDVGGLPNPYLGLRAFTYDDRGAFTGRENAVAEALRRITVGGDRQAVWFITGASGCGKSSFVQAGLLPALERHLQERSLAARMAVFRPGKAPLAGLADALAVFRLGTLTPKELRACRPTELGRLLAERTPAGQANLLVVDQFEECFTQAEKGEREWLFACLSELPAFSQARTLALTTLRSDYLNELFATESLWRLAKSGIELREMSEEELKAAIVGPLEARRLQALSQGDERYSHARFESALLDRLGQDAAADATYLPLLQVTLQQLWAGGKLKGEKYGHLADAVRQRAETVYAYQDFDTSRPAALRSEQERALILDLFLDLVSVSLDDDPRRDVRRSRPKEEFEAGHPERPKLVEELVTARLLSVSTSSRPGQITEQVDIIHESLLANWPRLQQAVAWRREQLQQRKRFEDALQEWLDNDQSDGYLLSGVRLETAKDLATAGDIATRSPLAKDFFQRSQQQAESELQRQLALERKARAGLQLLVGVLAVLLLASLVWAGYPYLLRVVARGELASIPAGRASIGPDPGFPPPRGEQVFLFDLPAFQIERYEVTVRQYGLCVQAQRCTPPSIPGDMEAANLPVTGVSAAQAAAYCAWLGRRLPSEVEWERAARGMQGRLWPWGDAPPTPEQANLAFTGGEELAPVASLPQGCSPSPEKVCGLIGNAAEWTSSPNPTENRYEPENRWRAEENPPGQSPQLIVRGFDYSTDPSGLNPHFSLAMESSSYPPYQAYENIGFRCSQ